MNSIRKFIRININYGLIASIVSFSVSVIGMVELFEKRDLITDVLTLGQVFLFGPAAFMGYLASRKFKSDPQNSEEVSLPITALGGIVEGLISAIPLVILVILATSFNLRQFLPNVSPTLIETITFGQTPFLGSVYFLLVCGVMGMIGAVVHAAPNRFTTPIMQGVLWTLVIGMFSEVFVIILRNLQLSGIIPLIFSGKALNPITAIILLILITAFSAWWKSRGETIKTRYTAMTTGREKTFRAGTFLLIAILLVLLPLPLGNYLSEVLNMVLIYALMGFGLNIVVGFAGLLDLGYVAFFAIGAYTMALLTSTSPLGIAGMSFWAAIPICVLVAVFFGIMLGVPVLRMRGDYLAIVTLGFGEIIRILALSDLLKPFIGGAQGILQINKPSFFGLDLVDPMQFYYVVLVGCLIAAFVSWRLSESRLGRQWMALREDEDVAEAMGINLISTKLLAFAIGAAFSGLSGAIFAAKLTSIFPHSFNLLVSINVLCLIIVGGMGSLPGVVVGALALVGLPELLREFAEYRLLAYGALLIVMMLMRPEGLWPSAVRKRELYVHYDEESGKEEAQVPEGA
jgi:branched-chain amino acid transport system permease protein